MTITALFTATEANRILPLVRQIVKDIVDESKAMRDAGNVRRALENHKSSKADEAYDATLIEVLKTKVADCSRKINEYLKELEGLGAEVKNLEKGLVDFPTEIDGKAAFLCWYLGETTVSHWHLRSENFANRKPLPRP